MYIDSYQLMAIKIINEKKLKLEEISFNKDGIIEEQEVQTALENGELWIAEFMRSNENRMISLEMLKKKESEAVIQAEI